MEPLTAVRRPRRMQIQSGAPRRLAAVLLFTLALAACTAGPGAGRSSGPSFEPVSPGASASPSGPVVVPGTGAVKSAEDAFRAVQARSPWFDKVEQKDPTLIGQAAWWDAKAGSNGSWQVTVQVGWGDCQAGCIDHHAWLWSVAADGAVTLVSESGASIPDDQRAALVKTATEPGIGGVVVAGPVCPVVRPGESGCNDKPVAGATLEVQDKDGKVVATFTTDASGLFRVPLAAGSYTLVAKPRDGLMGTPAPQPVTVKAGALAELVVSYDTGIR